MGTYAALVAGMQAMTVSGVTRHYDEPPGALSTADLPAAFPMLPSGGIGDKLVTCWSRNKTRAIQYVLALEPVGQGTQAQNYAALAAKMDALETSLDALSYEQSGTLTTFIEYAIEAAIIQVAGNDYWGIVADVSMRDV